MLHAQEKSGMELHNEGVAALRKSDYENATKAFEAALAADPENPSALFNLGLTHYKLGNEGKGLALWRKALAISPGFNQAAESIKWAESRLPRSGAHQEFSLWEQFREVFLISIALEGYLALFVGLLAICGWLYLRYFGNRRRALLDERPLPPFPWVAVVLTSLWVCVAFAILAKIYDMTIPRATVVQDKVPVRTAPDAASTTLFELIEGHEVVVRNFSEGWFQVSQPGGLTGWVPVDSVFVTSTQLQAEK